MAGRLLDYAGPVLRVARERASATQREVAEGLEAIEGATRGATEVLKALSD